MESAEPQSNLVGGVDKGGATLEKDAACSWPALLHAAQCSVAGWLVLLPCLRWLETRSLPLSAFSLTYPGWLLRSTTSILARLHKAVHFDN